MSTFFKLNKGYIMLNSIGNIYEFPLLHCLFLSHAVMLHYRMSIIYNAKLPPNLFICQQKELTLTHHSQDIF